ncbi:CocE/NonD family hydrolase [Variovorax sp. LjRoot290]|uniref:CocE/NonD family hydrolase n=1 Tax=unclassified Variovorax TaxID=663243 RepID=UPI003ED0ED01
MLDTNDLPPLRYRPAAGTARTGYPGLRPASKVLKRGHVHREGVLPLQCDVLFEQDAEVQLRDGTRIYVDVFRPVEAHDCPVLIGWSPYGKQFGPLNLDTFQHPARMDVPRQLEDGLNMFEAPNPSYWVSHGYAVISPDPRGIFSSEGDIHLWGEREARDEYDLIEWAGTRAWSNGKVGLAGNSYLAMTQWFVAAQRPPHLAAIAPWEGASDLYRDSSCRGGIPETVFSPAILGTLPGERRIEDAQVMQAEHPLYDSYWRDKAAALSRIEVPAYVTASWTNLVHTAGTLRGWSQLGSTRKWLRVHNTHEWNDLYNPANVEDLRRFFDHVLKGLDNGWQATPPVRLTVLDPGHADVVYRAEDTFPLARQELLPFYLTAEGSLERATPKQEAALSYDSADATGIKFRVTFDRLTEITGHVKAKLWVEAPDHDDMDLFVTVRKLDAHGQVQSAHVVTGASHEGPNGRLRVSMRRLDPERSRPELPVHAFDTVQKLSPGETVPVEIDVWPMSMRWHAGETLELTVNGVDTLVRPELPQLPALPTLNKGAHVLHVGGRYDAHLLLPFVSPA